MPYYDQYGPGSDEMGGGNAARDFAAYRQSSDFQRRPPAGWTSGGDPSATNPFTNGGGQQGGFFARLMRSLFGGGAQSGQIQSQPLPPLGGSTETNSPFGGYPAPPSTGKPATQLASSKAIMDRVSQMIGAPNEPPPYHSPEWSGPPNPGPLPDFSQQPPMANRPLLGKDGSFNPANAGASISPFDIMHMGLPKRQRVVMRADGGDVPGFMRGGYPELYTAPIRHTFESGGESYVGQHYGDANGRADNVNARLSPREYVMDAETMALLGDGNPDDGAKKMDTLRSNIRKHKGKALAKGKISPNAKAASSYIAGNPLGDGIRRAGLKT